MILEAIAIGILAGGWASATYWPGVMGVAVGVVAGFTAWTVLVTREEEKKEKESGQRKRSPKKGVCYGKQ